MEGILENFMSSIRFLNKYSHLNFQVDCIHCLTDYMISINLIVTNSSSYFVQIDNANTVRYWQMLAPLRKLVLENSVGRHPFVHISLDWASGSWNSQIGRCSHLFRRLKAKCELAKCHLSLSLVEWSLFVESWYFISLFIIKWKWA